MASSSTAASTSYANNNYYVYDIFINHRGPDCKKPFATNLYNRLCKRGLRVFLDVEELQEGDRLTSQIEGAIGTASVHIAIFSPRYVESEWCLNELVLMLESKATILPVFYGVKPSDLRWTQGENGVYARALRMLQGKKTCDSQSGQEKRRYEPVTIEKWRKALYDAADISGFEIENYNGDERQVEQVVAGVLKKVKRKLHVSKYPIALDEKVEHFERKMLLQQQSGQTRVIGIVGLGGVGKTTLAKEIFNRQISNYKESCFLSNVRETPLNSLNFLQNILLKKLAGFDEHINNTDEGIEMLRRYLSSSKALIILDDVDHIEQMNALLLPAKDVLHSGSLILVTSRNKDVLTSSGIEESSIYKLTGLDRQHSEELFCLHAFQQSNPVVGFEKVVNEFLDACDGLPLSLMVLGAHLHGKSDLKYWEAQLRKISKALPTDIQRRLKISYDGLDKEEKHIFLDIACFFIGEDRDTAIRIWDGSGWEGELGFRNLENKCIVEVDGKNQITMHDHLRDLGRDLAETEPPDCWRRLWRPDVNLINLSNQSPVRGISMKNGSEWPQQSTAMRSLQLIRAEGYSVQRIISVAQTLQLIWLCWNNCPYPSLPSWTPMENLRVLQIKGSEFETIWTEESQAPVQIRELDIYSRVLNVPKSIGKLIHLEKFLLHHNMYQSVGLKTLPDEFCLLQSLKHFLLRDCWEIESLPDSFRNLTSLQTIQLSRCYHLQRLPDSLGNLTSLQTIDLFGCSHLQRLPDSLGNLTSLRTINLAGCSHLQRLPDSLGNLTSLRTIHLYGCSHLQRLPDSLGNLTSLRTIDLSSGDHLQRLPDSLGNLTRLQTINLCGCYHLQRLPDSLGNLTSLQTINLCWSHLQRLPDSLGNLTSLQIIYLSCCSHLQRLPDSLGNLTSLQSIDLYCCSHLQRLPDSLGNLTSLRTIDLSDCSHLQRLPDSLGNLTSLRTINLSDCSHLQRLPDSLGNLTSLQSIYLSHCSHLQRLPGSLGNLMSLETIDLFHCSHLQRLPDSLGNLTSLETIDLSHCSHLQRLPDSLGNLTSFQTIDLSNCSHLQRLPDSLGNLTSLQTIDLSGCSHLWRLPDSLGNLTNLQTIDLSGCSRLQRLPESFGNLTNLQTIDLSRCSRLQRLPDYFSNLTQLRKFKINKMSNLGVLKIEDCNSNSRDASEVSHSEDDLEHVKIKDCNGLVEIEALPTTLRTLRTLKLSVCGTLKKVGGLSCLSKLHRLDISWCIELEELPSIETLVSLEEFRAFNCVKLKSIQGLEHLTKLRKLNINWCMELEELPSFETLVSLEELCAFNCVKVKSIHGLEQQSKLRMMNISGCIELEELPSIETLVSLEEFCAFNCVKLKSVQGLERLTKLRMLNINGCMELQKLPSIETLVSLQELSAFNCVKLKSIQGLEHLTELRTLNIDGCMELEELPCIEKLVSLKRLAARRCGKLKSIQGLAQLTKLQLLDVRECSELQDLPGVEYLELLETLYASGCPKLQWGGEVLEGLHERLKEGYTLSNMVSCQSPGESSGTSKF